MKLFLIKPLILTFILALLSGCATKKEQYGSNVDSSSSLNDKDSTNIAHTFYLIGDAGNTTEEVSKSILNALTEKLKVADKNSTLLFLGDNVYPKGIPSKKSDPNYESAEQKLLNQLEITKSFKGQTIFIPGNHDWYSGIEGLKKQEDLVQEFLNDKKGFSPRKGCAIDDVEINDNVLLVTIDSEWYLEDWNNSPTINDDCDIKTREAFFVELEDLLNKNKEKTVVLAMHHPLMSNGSHGGQYSLLKQIYPVGNKVPLPVIGSFLNLVRATSGVSPQDIQNKLYTKFINRIEALIKGQDNVVVVSGHDHNLQYIDYQNIKQIVSGAGSKEEAAKAVFPNDFSYGKKGFAILTVYKNGKASVSFHNEDKVLFQHTVLHAHNNTFAKYKDDFPATINASVYTKDRTKKSAAFSLIFGKHYRQYYSIPIDAKTVNLDTLYGGLTPTRAGGGHQSKSLRLVDTNGKEYAMRALKKSASRFLQAVAFKDQFVQEAFENTYAEDFLLDFYTSAHPYTSLAVGHLAEKIGVSHTNPKLFYVPKQNALQEFNTDYGDELYFIEEHVSEEQKDLASFNKPEDIISTEDVLEKLHDDEKYHIDEKAYIRARLLDMLIGDWDRHHDQWRWGEYKEGDKVFYKPIPRDRDQAFPKYDGALLAILMNIPDLRHMQTFKDEIKNVKWFNREPYTLDLAMLKTATANDWIEQANYIQQHLSDKDIDQAFRSLPKVLQDQTVTSIQGKLKSRKKELVKYAVSYAKTLEKRILIVGTNKKEQFIIEKKAGDIIKVTVNRIKKEGTELQYVKTISGKRTKHLWIYGLDDDDVFEVKGKAKSSIRTILLGGANHDNYAVENGAGIRIIDFKSKNNSFDTDKLTKQQLTDDYTVNTYNYTLPKYNAFSGLPTIGYNPDDGVKLGIIANYTVNNFKQNPYSRKHILKANYYFATSGFELMYTFKAPKISNKWDFNLETRFTSPNFAINFFGYGNETINTDDLSGKNFNRVKIRNIKVAPQFEKIGDFGSRLQLQTSFESVEVSQTTGRFIASPNIVNPLVFESQQFAGVMIGYHFENYDTPSFPTLGMGFSLIGSWKMNLNETEKNFPTIESKLNFNHKIDPYGKWVIAAVVKGKAILNNNYEFYQGAVLGGDTNLRGFRNERFLGKSSFYQSSDLRYNIGNIKESIVPMSYGVLAGFDYGRVWLDGEDSSKWHQAIGAGLWLNGIDTLTARLTYFKSRDEEARVSFGLGFAF
ncbi:metallophosphoesterase [Flavobacterium algicola]|uniref:metallophosphoesterase n=1 Tax=Flavobacterium algicola TaxID=556529 RepID=UPI001EFD050D|nr:metallophosphoesterase [Flavobacterium algicola]MCG9792409.1 metallophosphoesterase [Flavobacterium algicola]